MANDPRSERRPDRPSTRWRGAGRARAARVRFGAFVLASTGLLVAVALWSRVPREERALAPLGAAPTTSPAAPRAEVADSTAAGERLTAAGAPADSALASAPAEPDLPRLALRCRVVDRLDHSAIADATIELTGDEWRASATTGTDGTAELVWYEGLAASVLVRHASYAEARRPELRHEAGECLFELTPGGRIEGRVTVAREGLALEAAGVEPEALDLALWELTPQGIRGEPLRVARFGGGAEEARGASAALEANGANAANGANEANAANGTSATRDTNATDAADTIRRERDALHFELRGLARGTYALGARSDGVPLALRSGLVLEAGSSLFVELELTPIASLPVRVLERGSERPLEGARCRLRPVRQGFGESAFAGAALERTTDAAGRATLAPAPSGAVELEVRTAFGARAVREFELATGRAPELELLLPAAASLAGEVRGPGGDAIAGARVLCLAPGESVDERWASPSPPGEGGAVLARVETDELGRFRFDALPAGETLALGAWPPGGAVGSGGELARLGSKLRLEPGEARAGLVLALEPGGAIALRVRDEVGRPLEAASVRLDARLGEGWLTWSGGETDAAGALALTSLPPGPARLVVSATGYRREEVELRVPPPTSPPKERELQLVRASSIDGWIVDEYGDAIAGARLRATRDEGERTLRRGKAVDAFGRFRIENLEDGLWSLRPEALGWKPLAPEPLLVQLPNQAFASFVMIPDPAARVARVSGEIVRAGDGEPIPSLRLGGTRGGLLEVDGTRFTVSGMRPGRARLFAATPGYERRSFDAFDLPPGGEVDLGRLELRRSARLDVALRDESGGPVGRARVWLERSDSKKKGGAGGKARRIPLKRDSRPGSYTVEDIARGTYRLLAVDSEGRRASREIRLSKGKQQETLRVSPTEPERDSRKPKKPARDSKRPGAGDEREGG